MRDAAVELIGKYVIQLPEVAGDYYEKIADRILVSPVDATPVNVFMRCRILGLAYVSALLSY